jgi:hypothetical protein
MVAFSDLATRSPSAGVQPGQVDPAFRAETLRETCLQALKASWIFSGEDLDFLPSAAGAKAHTPAHRTGLIGEVQSPDADAAIRLAIKKFEIAAEHQSRVAARPIIPRQGAYSRPLAIAD